MIEQASKAVSHGDFEVFEENIETVNVFMQLSTSWKLATVGMGSVRFGIPSTEIESTLRLMGVHRRRRQVLFKNIRIMERAALETLSK